jgi:hypothetical protein
MADVTTANRLECLSNTEYSSDDRDYADEEHDRAGDEQGPKIASSVHCLCSFQIPYCPKRLLEKRTFQRLISSCQKRALWTCPRIMACITKAQRQYQRDQRRDFIQRIPALIGSLVRQSVANSADYRQQAIGEDRLGRAVANRNTNLPDRTSLALITNSCDRLRGQPQLPPKTRGSGCGDSINSRGG